MKDATIDRTMYRRIAACTVRLFPTELLTGWAQHMEQKYPGTKVDIGRDENGCYKHVVIAFGTAKELYTQKLINPVCAVDFAHCGEAKGTLGTCIAKYAQSNMCPLIIGHYNSNESKACQYSFLYL